MLHSAVLVSAVKKVNQLYDYIYPLFLRFPFHLEGFSVDSVVKNPPANAVDVDLIPRSGRSPREGNGNQLQYFRLGNATDRGAWRATVMGSQKNQTLLSDKTTTPLEHHRALNRVSWAINQFSLVIYLIHGINSVCVSIPISQSSPLLPLVSIHLFSISVSLLLLCK